MTSSNATTLRGSAGNSSLFYIDDLRIRSKPASDLVVAIDNAQFPTPTPTPPGATPTPAPFPATGVLDSFDRANGVIGSNWTGATGNFTINGSQLAVGGSENDIYWSGASFGAAQEAYVTLATIPSNATKLV
ncbi:MAG: hypothetical protein IPK16_05930 [Anaerolineales bacterium]|nr:hypothetical protein [Anaerolineales bacterium]